jgi:hypothetical protein
MVQFSGSRPDWLIEGGGEMNRERYTPEQIIGKLREAEVALSAMIRQLSLRPKPSIAKPYQYPSTSGIPAVTFGFLTSFNL